jgi:hypothetical protein
LFSLAIQKSRDDGIEAISKEIPKLIELLTGRAEFLKHDIEGLLLGKRKTPDCLGWNF